MNLSSSSRTAASGSEILSLVSLANAASNSPLSLSGDTLTPVIARGRVEAIWSACGSLPLHLNPGAGISYARLRTRFAIRSISLTPRWITPRRNLMIFDRLALLLGRFQFWISPQTRRMKVRTATQFFWRRITCLARACLARSFDLNHLKAVDLVGNPETRTSVPLAACGKRTERPTTNKE
jgi:hypothetical protein